MKLGIDSEEEIKNIYLEKEIKIGLGGLNKKYHLGQSANLVVSANVGVGLIDFKCYRTAPLGLILVFVVDDRFTCNFFNEHNFRIYKRLHGSRTANQLAQ